MINFKGKQRVVISHVSPEIDNGQFPGKTAVNETIIISADIYSDGHDELSASVYIRKVSQKKWTEIPLKFISNDHWTINLIPDQVGIYEFRIEAWIDHYKTWKHGLVKKKGAGQDITVELQIGAQLIKDAEVNLKLPKLAQWHASLLDSTKQEQAYDLAISDEVAEIMYKYRISEQITVYPRTLKIEVERKRAAYSTWYELFPRSTALEGRDHGTFNDVIPILPRIAKLGFDVLYFPPIHPIGEKNRKGKNNSLTALETDPGSPWAIGNRLGGHKAIHPALGTLKDFKKLLQEANRHGIEIAMDIAYQCAPDHPYVKEHPQWFKWRPDGTVQYAENPPKRYEDILPFNFETDDWENLWKELKSVIDYWVDAGVTIFRIDNPHTKAFRFWEWMIAEVRKAHPEVLFLAEAFTRPRIMERLGKAGFNQSYTYFTWRNTKKELEEYMTQLTKTDQRYYFRPNFWPNTPDILPPELTLGGENAHIMRVILAATLSSNYGIYGPVYEFGINQPHGAKEEYVDNEKYEIKHWDWEATTRIGEIITRVNRIRKENAALQSTWNIELAESDNDQIICYAKKDQQTSNLLVIVVNLDVFNSQSGHVRIPLERLNLPSLTNFKVTDLLSGETYEWNSDWNYVQLDPHRMPAHIFKVEHL
ncbi:MAG: alpha-1,4-glucan--maltose-1-phosphate maltosyltransferase [Pedobacter sp.]